MPETKEAKTVVKTVENAILYSDGTILLKNARCSYPHLFTPQENKNDEGVVTKSYACTGLMNKDTHDAAKKLCVQVINDMLKTKGENGQPLKIPANKKFIKNGDPTDEDDEGKPENLNMWVVSTRESKKPHLLHKKKDPKTGKAKRLTDEDKDLIYGGCYVNMLIRPWFQSNKYGKRVNAGISAVQFVRDGEPFGQGRITDSDLDDRFEIDEDESETDAEFDTDGL